MNSAAITTGGILLMLAVIVTSGAVGRFSTFYRRELGMTGDRELALDGLRGMAALLVVTYHSALSYARLTTGKWGDAGSSVIQAFGPGGVLIFFMLTGYLFWSKARAAKGRYHPWKLWRGRLYRIGPLYLFSLGVVLLVALAKFGVHWLAPGHASALLHLLPLGALHWQPVGPVDLGDINYGVVWTLWYEWRFYLALPFIAWLAVGRRTLWLAAAAYVTVFAGLWFKLNLQPGLVFVLGMLCPVLLEDRQLRSRLQHPALAAVVLVFTVVMCVLNRGYALSVLPSISLAGSLFPLFFLVVAGNSFFGFLTLRAVRCLGAISFSLYLLHSVVFYLMIGAMKTPGLTARLLPYYWPLITLAAVAATLVCAATYRWIEFPFLSRHHRRQGAGL